MLNAFLVLFRFSLIFFFLLPLVLRLINKEKSDFLNVSVATVGLSFGLGSYFLFLVYLFNGKLVTQTSSFLFFLLIFFLLFLLFKKETLLFISEQTKGIKTFLGNINPRKIIYFFFDGPAGMIRLVIAILLFYAFLRSPFFPISQWDDLVRYAAWGNSIFSRGEISSQINTYPILVPLLYTYGFLSSGFRNDYLIKLIPLTFGLLTLVLTYLMANEFFEKRKYRGLLAVFFSLCFLPFFDWFHLGYTDIASAFYFNGTLYFFYLYIKERKHLYPETKSYFFADKNIKYLIFFGLFWGLSLWVKQQTIPVFVSIFLASLLIFVNQKKEILDMKFSISFKEIMVSFVLSFFIFSPWYIRDFALIGMPVRFHVTETVPSIENLFPFIHNWQSVGYYGSAFFQVALFFAIACLFVPSQKGLTFTRRHVWFLGVFFLILGLIPFVFGKHPGFILTLDVNKGLLFFSGAFFLIYGFFFFKNIVFKLRNVLILVFVWLLPFYLGWWLNYTSIIRYLITVIPLFVLIFVFVFDELFPIVEEKIKISKVSHVLIILLLVGFVLPRFSDALRGVGLEYFFADRKTKGLKIIDDSFVAGEYLDSLNLSGRPKIISTDNRLAYFAPRMDFYNITPAYLSDLLGFDYYILNPWTKEAYDLRKKREQEVYFNLIQENPKVFEKIYEHTPYKVYKIILTDSDFITPKSKMEEVKEGIKKIKAEKIENVSGAATPAIIPGDWRYPLKRLKDELDLFQGRVYFNRPQTITFIASKRLLEAYEVCFYRQRCNLAIEPLQEFRKLMAEMEAKSLSRERLFIDESFYLSSQMEKNFVPWGVILFQMSQKDSPAFSLAREIFENDFYRLVYEFYNKSYRLEPNFSYYDKNGELVLTREK